MWRLNSVCTASHGRIRGRTVPRRRRIRRWNGPGRATAGKCNRSACCSREAPESEEGAVAGMPTGEGPGRWRRSRPARIASASCRTCGASAVAGERSIGDILVKNEAGRVALIPLNESFNDLAQLFGGRGERVVLLDQPLDDLAQLLR